MSTRNAAATAASIAETDLAEINTATKQSFEQQLRVTTDINFIVRQSKCIKCVKHKSFHFFTNWFHIFINILVVQFPMSRIR